MTTNSSMFLGEKRKMNVHVEPLNDINMSDIEELLIQVYCSPKRAIEHRVFRKDGVIGKDHQLLLDTTVIGVGRVFIQVTAIISDGSVEGKQLVDIDRIDTGINIIK